MSTEIQLSIQFFNDTEQVISFPTEVCKPKLDGQVMILEGVTVYAVMQWLELIEKNPAIRPDYCQISLRDNGVKVVFSPEVKINLRKVRGRSL